MSFTTALLRARSSFWFLPAIYGLVAIILAVISVKVDTFIRYDKDAYEVIPSIFLSDIDLATTILSSISSSLLTMTTITFSTILVVLTTYLSQFSPRTLQDFITDHRTQRVLGIFVGGFVYSILLLLFLRDEEPAKEVITPSFAVVFAIICLLVFVFFIHHVSSWIQVSNLIHNITLTTIAKIERTLKDREDVQTDAPWDDWENEEIKHIEPLSIRYNMTGYLQHLDVDGIVKEATRDQCIVKIEKKIGDYIDQDTTVLSIWPMEQNVVKGDYKKFLSIGTKKAAVDDIEFGLTKIVEIALRALSPGINDPNTAINCIDNLGKILTKIGKKHLPKAFHNDEERNLRVILDKPIFSDYLYKCFYQIRQYGIQDISVLSAVLVSLTFIAENNENEIKEVIWEFAQYIREGINEENLLSLDRKHINHQLESLAKASGHSKDFQKIPKG